MVMEHTQSGERQSSPYPVFTQGVFQPHCLANLTAVSSIRQCSIRIRRCFIHTNNVDTSIYDLNTIVTLFLKVQHISPEGNYSRTIPCASAVIMVEHIAQVNREKEIGLSNGHQIHLQSHQHLMINSAISTNPEGILKYKYLSEMVKKQSIPGYYLYIRHSGKRLRTMKYRFI